MSFRKATENKKFLYHVISLALNADSIPDEITLEDGSFDITAAGAEWLASEMKGILSKEHRSLYTYLRTDEIALEEDSLLLNDIYRCQTPTQIRSFLVYY